MRRMVDVEELKEFLVKNAPNAKTADELLTNVRLYAALKNKALVVHDVAPIGMVARALVKYCGPICHRMNNDMLRRWRVCDAPPCSTYNNPECWERAIRIWIGDSDKTTEVSTSD